MVVSILIVSPAYGYDRLELYLFIIGVFLAVFWLTRYGREEFSVI